MPAKWVLYWEPETAGSTMNTQILVQMAHCIEESFSAVKDGRWKTTLTLYKPIVRDPSIAMNPPHGLPRDFTGVFLGEQPNKYYFIVRGQRIILEADLSILTIMDKLESYRSGVVLNFEGLQFRLGDFQLKLGKVTTANTEILRGIIMEVDYLPISSLEKCKPIMEDFLGIVHENFSKRSLMGRFRRTNLNFDEYGLSDEYTPSHTCIQYAAIVMP